MEHYANGRLFEAYAVQQQSYKTDAQRTGVEETAFPGIGVEYIQLRSKVTEFSNRDHWRAYATNTKKKGIDDITKVYVHISRPNVYFIEAEFMAPSIAVSLLVARADFLQRWVETIPHSSLVKRLDTNAYIVRISVRNPISSMMSSCEKYIKVNYAIDDKVLTTSGTARKKKAFVTYTSLSEQERTLHDIPPVPSSSLGRIATPDFFDFQSVLFVVFNSEQDLSAGGDLDPGLKDVGDEVTNCHVYVEGMKFVRNSPTFLNSLYFPDLLSKMCINWAIQARCLELHHAKFGQDVLRLHKELLHTSTAYPVLAHHMLPPPAFSSRHDTTTPAVPSSDDTSLDDFLNMY